MSDSFRMEVVAGEPYSAVLTFTGGGVVGVWADEADFEVRAQVRSGKGERYTEVFDLTPFLAWELGGAGQIIVTVSLTGAQTRTAQSGYYDMFISDLGVTDARARKVLSGRLEVTPAITAAS